MLQRQIVGVILRIQVGKREVDVVGIVLLLAVHVAQSAEERGLVALLQRLRRSARAREPHVGHVLFTRLFSHGVFGIGLIAHRLIRPRRLFQLSVVGVYVLLISAFRLI
ncbi:hypothetical protein SDC9_203985 [bioreactor metagenome]|uniref:Uncharacterized protein n=1 Tax=bioreactor metagenome TaxID=1076179 RepID=A0A645J0R0_9ZZZZ